MRILVADGKARSSCILSSDGGARHTHIVPVDCCRNARILADTFLFDWAIVYLDLQDGSGLDLVTYLYKINPKTRCIVVTEEHQAKELCHSNRHPGIWAVLPKEKTLSRRSLNSSLPCEKNCNAIR